MRWKGNESFLGDGRACPCHTSGVCDSIKETSLNSFTDESQFRKGFALAVKSGQEELNGGYPRKIFVRVLEKNRMDCIQHFRNEVLSIKWL